MTALRLLLVEDHKELAETTGAYLEACGHLVDYARDGREALHLSEQATYDVVVLDIMLPRMSGYEVCERLRERDGTGTPIIMLTARDRLEDKLQGFELGADDYLVKPFDMPELVARVEALVRRSTHVSNRYEVGELVLDATSLQVWRQGKPIALSSTGFKILETLIRAYPSVVSREDLSWRLWREEPPESDALRSHLYMLRQALDRPFAYRIVTTLPGRGYCLRIPDVD